MIQTEKIEPSTEAEKFFKSLANIPLIDSDFLTNVIVTGQVYFWPMNIIAI